LLKEVFYHYFQKGAKWTCMPKPMMLDRSFDLSEIKDGFLNMPWESVEKQAPSEYEVGHEMMIDAAQCLRFGKDILVNVANKNHELGFQWLERHLSPKFRVHKLYRLSEGHIDTMILPLKPGTLLLRYPEILSQLPKQLQKWDIIFSCNGAATRNHWRGC
jgi:glycine amidinotransferase